MTLNKVDRSRVVSATKEPDCHANRILQHSVYRECYEKIVQCEKDRIFCHHDMVHFLDVARLAEIFNLQEDLQISKKLVYGAALLHDIGRFEQYLEGIPHEEASARIAPSILRECGYLSEVIDTVAWKTALENQKAVYLIVDSSNGKKYVGSAYGEKMLHGRWTDYIQSGHGGNVDLKTLSFEHIKDNFRYSILEIFKSTTNDETILERETWWKEVLLTRGEFGYNKN